MDSEIIDEICSEIESVHQACCNREISTFEASIIIDSLKDVLLSCIEPF